MLNTPKLRGLYAEIQSQLFYMIPEKWESIYLYASVIDRIGKLQTGEMFFYYFPKGILKKNPVNVYEVPGRFNLNEEAYLKLADNLYHTIQTLRKEFERMGEKLWSNMTLSIVDAKLSIEYHYENLLNSSYSNYDRHIIWMCKYLQYPIERLSKKDRAMLLEYEQEQDFKNEEIQVYTEGMYHKKVHNSIEYDKSEVEIPEVKEKKKKVEKEKVALDPYEAYKQRKVQYGQYTIEKRKQEEVEKGNKKEDPYEAYKRQMEEKKQKTIEGENRLKQEAEKLKESRNQILNFK